MKKMELSVDERLAQLEVEKSDLIQEAKALVAEAQHNTDFARGEEISDALTSIDEQLADIEDEKKAITPEPVVKFQYNGMKVDGKLYKGYYSMGSYHKSSGIPSGTITIYSKDYSRFPRIDGLIFHNDSDIQTDYFDTDKIRVTPDSPYYKKVLAGYQKQEDYRNKVTGSKRS